MTGPKLTITYYMLSSYCPLPCLQDCCSQEVEYNHLALTYQMQASVSLSDLAHNCRSSNPYQICYHYYLQPLCSYCTIISEKYIQSHISHCLTWHTIADRLTRIKYVIITIYDHFVVIAQSYQKNILNQT